MHTITLTVTNAGGSDTDTVSINIVDSTGPVITPNGQTVALWPPNHKFRTVSVADLIAGASDECDGGVSLASVVITKVSSDEGTAASGDIVIAADCKSVRLRAERNGSGNGRVYTITLRASDGSGNTTTVTRQVVVPHDQSGGGAVDDGPAYTINSSCP